MPGPQFPLYVLGRKLSAFYPMVPLVLNTALGIAIMSYDGRIFFGLLGDYDAMSDLDDARGRPRVRDRRAGGRRRRAAERGAPQRTLAAGVAADQEPRLRRLGLVAAGLLVAVAGLVALTLAFNARDDPELARAPRARASSSPTAAPATARPAQVTDPGRPAARTSPRWSRATAGS